MEEVIKMNMKDQTFKIILSLPLIFLLSSGIFSCGKPDGVETKTKVNSPPLITGATIVVDKPTRDKDLGVAVHCQDPDQDPVSYRYQWIRNDTEMVEEKGNVLKGGRVKKGDLIQVRVIPSDQKGEGKPFLTDPIKILNSPPVIQEVLIEPKIASVKDNLKVNVKYFDRDEDFVYFSYRWEKNGNPLGEEGKEILEGNRFKKGDSLTVTVTPDDRETLGIPMTSIPVIISNSPPSITSSPSTSVDGTKYLYQVKADDPDHDTITYILKLSPKGMEIDKNTGLIHWEIRKEDKGNHAVEIEASDGDGGKGTQRYLLTVEFKSIK